MSSEVKKVALMKILFEDPRFHARRHGLHSDMYTYDEPRDLLMEQAPIKDGERAVDGSARELAEQFAEQPSHESEQRPWLEYAQ